jgi:hypothetical protein
MLITLHLLPLMIWVSILTWRNAGLLAAAQAVKSPVTAR